MTAQVILAGVACFAVGGDQSAKDLKRMEGLWIANVLQLGGNNVSAKDAARFKVQLSVSGDRYNVFVDGQLTARGTMKLDANRKIGYIDLNVTYGDSKGKQQLGLYKFEGPDEMKVVFADPGQPRPSSFSTRAGSQEMLIGYRRQK